VAEPKTPLDERAFGWTDVVYRRGRRRVPGTTSKSYRPRERHATIDSELTWRRCKTGADHGKLPRQVATPAQKARKGCGLRVEESSNADVS